MSYRTPMTYEQAKQTREKYAYLIGAPFGKYIVRDVIEHITVAPFKTSLQWFFAEVFRVYHSMEKSMKFYHGSEYDVILITHNSSNQNAIFLQDIHTYLKENGE
jgi:hypothetical protein